MSKFIIFIFFIFSISIHSKSHNFPITYYKISKNDGQYILTIRFDKDEIQKQLEMECEKMPVIDYCITKFVDYYVQIHFNNVYIPTCVESYQSDDQLYIFNFKLESDIEKVENIHISITTFLHINPNHNNIVISELNNQSRTFRLSNKRTFTVIKY